MSTEDEWNAMISDMENSEVCYHFKTKESLEEKVDRLEKEIEVLKAKICGLYLEDKE